MEEKKESGRRYSKDRSKPQKIPGGRLPGPETLWGDCLLEEEG